MSARCKAEHGPAQEESHERRPCTTGAPSSRSPRQWAANPTWEQLKELTSIRARLAILYGPAAPEVDVATDLKNLSEVFGQVCIRTV